MSLINTDTILSSNVKCFNCLLMSKRDIVGVDERCWINLKLSSLWTGTVEGPRH